VRGLVWQNMARTKKKTVQVEMVVRSNLLPERHVTTSAGRIRGEQTIELPLTEATRLINAGVCVETPG
jgi:hypothetical protein